MESLRNFLTGPRLFIVIAACALPFVFLGTSSLANPIGGSLGSINGEDVSQGDFQVATNFAIQKYQNIYGDDFDFASLDDEIQMELIKQELIIQKSLLAEARSLGLINNVTQREAKKSIISNPSFWIDGRFDENTFEAQANANGFTKDEYIDQISLLLASDIYRTAINPYGFSSDEEASDLALILEQSVDINFIKIDSSRLEQGITNTNRYLANLSLEYDLTSNLKAKVTLGLDQSDSDNFSITSGDVLGLSSGIAGNGRGAYNMLEVKNELLEATLTYNKEYTDSKLEVLGGFSYQSFQSSGLYSGAWGFSTTDMDLMGSTLKDVVTGISGEITDQYQQFAYAPNLSGVIVRGWDGLDFTTNTFSPSTSTSGVRSLAVDTYDNTTELQSFFGRVNYTLSDKYLFTATLRADGSSAFPEANRYGYFPSGAFAWKLNEEDFMSDSNMSTLKLRLSAGITGNQEGVGYGNYVNRSRWTGLNPNDGGDINLGGNAIVSFGGNDLKWESTIQYSTGLDFGFNNDRLSGSLDVYRKETKDLLFLVPEAQPAILDQKFRNLPDSKIVNQGVEFSLGYDLVQSEDFNWSANFNVAYNDNMVENLSGQYDFADVNGPGLSGAFAMRLQEGYPLFSYYLLQFDGYDNAGQPIISEDKSFVGKSALPNLTGGLSTNLNYKRWSMSAYFSGQFGHYVYNNTANAFFTAGAFNTTRNVTPETLTSGEALGASAAASTRFLEKGDFVRLQNLSLAYDMPLSGKGVFKSMVFSVTGQNLWLSTDYSGLDPEVNSATGGALPSIGMDYGAYPNPTTITFGVNAKF